MDPKSLTWQEAPIADPGRQARGGDDAGEGSGRGMDTFEMVLENGMPGKDQEDGDEDEGEEEEEERAREADGELGGVEKAGGPLTPNSPSCHFPTSLSEDFDKKDLSLGRSIFSAPPRSGRRFKGVRRRKWGRFVCEIRDAIGKRIWLGSYDQEEEAARAYDEAARTLQGEGAWLNFPNDPPGLVCLPDFIVSTLVQHKRHLAYRRYAGSPVLGGPARESPLFHSPTSSIASPSGSPSAWGLDPGQETQEAPAQAPAQAGSTATPPPAPGGILPASLPLSGGTSPRCSPATSHKGPSCASGASTPARTGGTPQAGGAMNRGLALDIQVPPRSMSMGARTQASTPWSPLKGIARPARTAAPLPSSPPRAVPPRTPPPLPPKTSPVLIAALGPDISIHTRIPARSSLGTTSTAVHSNEESVGKVVARGATWAASLVGRSASLYPEYMSQGEGGTEDLAKRIRLSCFPVTDVPPMSSLWGDEGESPVVGWSPFCLWEHEGYGSVEVMAEPE